jgi:hypothetical protein
MSHRSHKVHGRVRWLSHLLIGSRVIHRAVHRLHHFLQVQILAAHQPRCSSNESAYLVDGAGDEAAYILARPKHVREGVWEGGGRLQAHVRCPTLLATISTAVTAVSTR